MMAEKEQSIICLDEEDEADQVPLMLDYMYNPHIAPEKHMSQDNYTGLVKLARYFGVPELHECLAASMEASMNLENAADYLNKAAIVGDQHLLTLSVGNIAQNKATIPRNRLYRLSYCSFCEHTKAIIETKRTAKR
jgi:hypothetical protein